MVYLLARARVIFVKGWLIEIRKCSLFVLLLLTDYYRNLTEGEAMTINKFLEYHLEMLNQNHLSIQVDVIILMKFI